MKHTTYTDEQLREMPIEELVQYVIDEYHKYIRNEGPKVRRCLVETVAKHGQYHPTLFEVNELFDISMMDLEHHLRKEEEILFPYIEQLADTEKAGMPLAPFHCGSVANPIEVMKMEHQAETLRYDQISDLTGGFSAPDDAAEDFLKAYLALQEFDYMLREHIHVENDILFPRAIDLEAKLREFTAVHI